MKRKTFVEVFEDVLKVAHDPLILESVLTEQMQAILQVSIVAQSASSVVRVLGFALTSDGRLPTIFAVFNSGKPHPLVLAASAAACAKHD